MSTDPGGDADRMAGHAKTVFHHFKPNQRAAWAIIHRVEDTGPISEEAALGHLDELIEIAQQLRTHLTGSAS